MKQLIIMTATDEELKELKEHLSNNGYRSEWTSNSIILVDDDETSELYEILTIINDREIEYFTSPVELDDILNVDMGDFGFDIFSIDDLEEMEGYNSEEDNREHFSKTFVFPIEKKKQIICYLKKHQNEIVEQIIKESENDD